MLVLRHGGFRGTPWIHALDVTRSCQSLMAHKRKMDDSTADDASEDSRIARARAQSPPVGSVSLDFSRRGAPPPLPENITVISLNVSGLSPSSAAPAGWDPIPAFRSEILRHSPDIVCLQEVPDGGDDGFLPGYVCVGTCESHCENVALFFKQEWADHTVRISRIQSPAVLANLAFSLDENSTKGFTFGSCHLAPFKSNAASRLEQVKDILQTSTTEELIIGGDFNMRAFEDQKVEKLGLEDAWKSGGFIRSEKNTWDSVDRTPNGAPKGSGPHNRYHGEEAFQFACRFDRVYLRGGIAVTDFRLFANKPLTNPFHYLSDHFGMVATLKINDYN